MVSTPRVTVRGIIYRDGKLFLQKLNGKNGTNTFWCTPGGKLDAGENILHGLRREIIEETGIEPKIGRLLFIQQYKEPDGPEWLEFFYLIENTNDYATIDLDSTTHGTIEIAECDFVDPHNITVLPEALGELDLGAYVTEHKPVYLMDYLSETGK
jgi:ADP-ribose pyrophosphatase YjhB (NUDIX family)